VKRAISNLRALASLSWRIFAPTVGAKFRKSFLGYFWMVAPALLITAGVTLANRAGIINSGATGMPYPLFVLIGTLIWQVFVEAFGVPHAAFEGARTYLTRVYFRREAILLAQLIETMITAAVRLLLVMLIVTFYYGPEPLAFLWVPVCFLGAVLLGLGCGSLLMPFTLLFTDLHQAIRLVLAYGLFLTPAMYQPKAESAFATLVRLNPVSTLMDAARHAAAGTQLQNPQALVLVLAAAVVLTIAGFALVRGAAPIVIERMLLGGR